MLLHIHTSLFFSHIFNSTILVSLLRILYSHLFYYVLLSTIFFHGLPVPMKSFKTKLKLNNKQKTLLAKHAGVARHAYNWGLATCIKEYEETKKRPSAITLHKRLVAEVKSVNPWYYEVSNSN